MYSRTTRLQSLIAFFSFSLTAIVFLDPAAAQSTRTLFTHVEEQTTPLDFIQSERLRAVRARPYIGDLHLARIATPKNILSAGSIQINLPDSERMEAVGQKTFRRGDDDFTWIGEIRGLSPDQPGRVLLIISGSDVTGSFYTDEAAYSIEPLGGGVHVIIRLDQSMLPQCGLATDESNGSTAGKASESIGGLENENESGIMVVDPIVDVLVVYTAAAANASGNIGSVAQGLVDALNDALANSLTPASAQLAHHAQVSYDEGPDSWGTHVGRLQGTSDTYMDNVHNLRDQY